MGYKALLAVAKMITLGIALIIVGVALLCSGLIFYRSSEEPADEAPAGDNEEVSREQTKEPPEDGLS